jgi:hypothetical protein
MRRFATGLFIVVALVFGVAMGIVIGAIVIGVASFSRIALYGLVAAVLVYEGWRVLRTLWKRRRARSDGDESLVESDAELLRTHPRLPLWGFGGIAAGAFILLCYYIIRGDADNGVLAALIIGGLLGAALPTAVDLLRARWLR